MKTNIRVETELGRFNNHHVVLIDDVAFATIDGDEQTLMNVLVSIAKLRARREEELSQ